MPSHLKSPPFRSEAWLRAVSSLPCQNCGREGLTQAAHRNQSKGMGMKTDDCLTAALCVDCHARVDQGTHMTREDRRAMLDAMILATLVELCNQGLVCATKPR